MNERSRELIGYIDVNPKIRELASQAGCSIDRLGFGEGNLEKFAELIVEECVDTILDCSIEYTTRPQIAQEIKQHFGVEE